MRVPILKTDMVYMLRDMRFKLQRYDMFARMHRRYVLANLSDDLIDLSSHCELSLLSDPHCG